MLTIYTEHVIFLQGVFPALLHNSMKYGFENKTNCKFGISIIRKGNVLQCEVRDNGEGSDISAYRTSDPDDALNILDSRIINAFKLKRLFYWDRNGIEIQASKETGTTIKFRYPYAKVKNTVS